MIKKDHHQNVLVAYVIGHPASSSHGLRSTIAKNSIHHEADQERSVVNGYNQLVFANWCVGKLCSTRRVHGAVSGVGAITDKENDCLARP